MRLTTACFLLLALGPPGVSALPNDWPSFRGPSQNGGVAAPGLFEGETTGLQPAWSQRLGAAYSGIAIDGDRVFTMAAIGDDDWLLALDEERGAELWRYRVGPRTRGHDGSEDGPAVTPAVTDDLVYATSATGRLFAVDIETGRQTWSVDLVATLGATHPLYDFVSSPAIAGDIVVSLAPGAENGSLAGFDRRTGAHLWSAAPGKGENTSPVVAELVGEQQILLWQEARLDAVGLDGTSLWSVEFGPNDNASPVVIEGDRVLLQGQQSSALYRIERTADGSNGSEVVATQLWQSRDLKGSMTAPVYRDGHIYGFDGRFLSCVDASNGRRVWKSRPPGGNGVILVEDRLVVFGADGHVVLVRATPEGYQEETRYKATERESLTWPAFANGKVYVRDATHLAALRITDQPTPASDTVEGPPILYEGSQFTSLIRRVEKSDNPQLYLDDFFRRQSSFPIYEGELIHFVYRGPATDVAVLSPIWDPQKEFPLARLGETQVFYRTMKLDPPTRLEYAFRVDLGATVADPLNPRTVERYPGAVGSEAVPPGYRDESWLAPYEGDSPGRRETMTLTSEYDPEGHDIDLWLPPLTAGQKPSGLLVILDGPNHTRLGQLPNTLSHLVGQSVAPIAAAFVPNLTGAYWLEADGRKTRELVRMLAEDLIPAIETRLGVDFARDQIAVLGAEMWSSAALHAGLRESGTIGHALVIDYNGTLSLADELAELLARSAGVEAAHFQLVWPRHGSLMTGRYVMREEAIELDRKLRSLGYRVEGGEVVDSPGWGGYKAMIVSALERVFPVSR